MSAYNIENAYIHNYYTILRKNPCQYIKISIYKVDVDKLFKIDTVKKTETLLLLNPEYLKYRENYLSSSYSG